MTTKQTEALLFIQQGLQNGHIKCSPYIETNPNAEQIELKSLHTLVDEALKDADEQAKEIADLREGLASMTAAIQFAMNDIDCGNFLELWLHGDFDVLRREWPEAPEEIYAGQIGGAA